KIRRGSRRPLRTDLPPNRSHSQTAVSFIRKFHLDSPPVGKSGFKAPLDGSRTGPSVAEANSVSLHQHLLSCCGSGKASSWLDRMPTTRACFAGVGTSRKCRGEPR